MVKAKKMTKRIARIVLALSRAVTDTQVKEAKAVLGSGDYRVVENVALDAVLKLGEPSETDAPQKAKPFRLLAGAVAILTEISEAAGGDADDLIVRIVEAAEEVDKVAEARMKKVVEEELLGRYGTTKVPKAGVLTGKCVADVLSKTTRVN